MEEILIFVQGLRGTGYISSASQHTLHIHVDALSLLSGDCLVGMYYISWALQAMRGNRVRDLLYIWMTMPVPINFAV